MSSSRDTIVAIATAHQNAGVGIVRLSGQHSLDVLKAIFCKTSGEMFEKWIPRHLTFGKILDEQNQLLDEALAAWMPGPNSFTGEDVVELHCHGNVHLLKVVMRRVLAEARQWPIRAAEPGEFTKRAFLNGKMDLTQAEAVQDLIASQSEASVRANLANLDGALSRQIVELKEKLLSSLALVEASFEFPEEDIQTYDAAEVLQLLAGAIKQLENLLSAYQTSKLYDEGVTVAIVGKPNVGKSSLLNTLLLEDRAIVTDIAGTTRDVVQGAKIINGIRFNFLDTAGLRHTTDVVEAFGIQKSKETAERADIVLYVTDSIDENEEIQRFSANHHFRILNKADLFRESDLSQLACHFDLMISTKERINIKELEERLCTTVEQESVQINLHINERQHSKINKAHQSVQNIVVNWQHLHQTELLAEELRHLVQGLDEVTGTITSDNILGEIFKRFCIGK